MLQSTLHGQASGIDCLSQAISSVGGSGSGGGCERPIGRLASSSALPGNRNLSVGGGFESIKSLGFKVEHEEQTEV